MAVEKLRNSGCCLGLTVALNVRGVSVRGSKLRGKTSEMTLWKKKRIGGKRGRRKEERTKAALRQTAHTYSARN